MAYSPMANNPYILFQSYYEENSFTCGSIELMSSICDNEGFIYWLLFHMLLSARALRYKSR